MSLPKIEDKTLGWIVGITSFILSMVFSIILTISFNNFNTTLNEVYKVTTQLQIIVPELKSHIDENEDDVKEINRMVRDNDKDIKYIWENLNLNKKDLSERRTFIHQSNTN